MRPDRLKDGERENRSTVLVSTKPFQFPKGDLTCHALPCLFHCVDATPSVTVAASHATLGVFKKLWRRRDPVLRSWEDCGQPKITLQVGSESALLGIYQTAKDNGVPTFIVVDAGRTQIAPNTR